MTDCRDRRVTLAFLVETDSRVRREKGETLDFLDSPAPEVYRDLVVRRVSRGLQEFPENQEQRATLDHQVSTGPQDPLVSLASPALASQDHQVYLASLD